MVAGYVTRHGLPVPSPMSPSATVVLVDGEVVLLVVVGATVVVVVVGGTVVVVVVVLVVVVVVDVGGTVVVVVVGGTVVVAGGAVVDGAVVVVVVVGVGAYGEKNTIGRYRCGFGHASRSMLRALFETVIWIDPNGSRHGSRWAWYVFILGSALRGSSGPYCTVVHGPHG